MSEIVENGQITESLESSDQAVEQTTEETPKQETVETEKPKTKQVSERINKIRADGEKKMNEMREDYEKRIKDMTSELNKFKADKEGITLDEYVQRERDEQDRIAKLVEQDPRYKQAMLEQFNIKYQNTLTAINGKFPEENLKDLENLPKEFYEDLNMGRDASESYERWVIGKRESAPPSSGSVKAGTTEESKQKSYSAEELNAMSDEDFDKLDFDELMQTMRKNL